MLLVQKGAERRKALNLLKPEYFYSSKTGLKIHHFLTLSTLQMIPSATVSPESRSPWFHQGFGMPAPTQ